MVFVMIIDGHQWMQKPPLRDKALVCITFGAEKTMKGAYIGESCAKRLSDKHDLIFRDAA